MMRRIPLLLCFVLAFSAACVRPGFAQDPAAHRAALEKDGVELGSYALTMDTVTRLFQATHAAAEAAKADPSMKVSFAGEENAESPTIDELASKLSTSPKIVAFFATYQFTPREFARASLSLIQTGIAMMAMQSGKLTDEAARAAHINPANVKLLQEHQAEMSALQTKYPTS